MAGKPGARHVATIKRKYKDKVYVTHLLRRTYREDGKVKHETLANLTALPDEAIALVKLSLRGEACAPVGEASEILRSLPHGHVVAVLGTLRRLGLERILASRPCRERDLVVAMIVERILNPAPKLATARGLCDEARTDTLSGILGVRDADEDDLYAAMDWLLLRQGAIEKRLAKQHLDDGTLVLYDVSSSYYTGRHCPLAEYGHNRDPAPKRYPQINYGLLCNADGCPVAIAVFKGSTGDPSTLATQITKLRERFGLKNVVLVGDRGLITSARIREELAPVEGLDWITALRAPSIRQLVEQGAIQLSLFDKRDLVEFTSPDYPGERLVACKNPLLADERARKREELLRATERKLDKIVAATERKKRALKGKDEIALRVGKVLGRSKVAKHFDLEFSEDSFSYSRRADKIAAEAATDGVYVIRTSVDQETLAAEETVSTYKSLSRVERAFRCLKTVDLKIRPIHHRLANRVRGHVFLCMLAYYVEWHMRQALAPILFEDDDRATAEASRESAVAPAQRSPSAAKKAATKRTADGLPVHSLQSLLKDLATLVKNRVRCTPPRTQPIDYDLVTTPTPIQRRALELLGVRLLP